MKDFAEPRKFVSTRDLTTPMPPLFAVGPWSSADIVVSEARYRHLVRIVKLMQMKGSEVAVLDENAVEQTLAFQPRAREPRAPVQAE